MDNETQSFQPIATQKTAPASGQKINPGHHILFSLISLLVLIIGMGAVYLWQHSKVTSLSSQLNNDQTALIKDSKLSLDNLNAVMSLPNTVVDTAASPADLIAFLGADNTHCYMDGQTGYYKVLAQANDEFAKMQYGCLTKNNVAPTGSSPTYILAKKTNAKWSIISPTNQWLTIGGQTLPSCTMVNQNKVSKLVTPECWQGPAISGSGAFNLKNYSAVPVTNP